jgi:hypothetical protein
MTKKERFEIYEKMLKYLTEIKDCNYCIGFCDALENVVPFNCCVEICELKELMKYKPKIMFGLYWFDSSNLTKRINILKEILNQN